MTRHKRDLTRAQINNLDKLATYLENLPERYRHFGMSNFLHNYDDLDPKLVTKYALNNGGVDQFPCGTVACAVGHGPAAGILFRKGVDAPFTEVYDTEAFEWVETYDPDWDKYSERFAPRRSSMWEWFFGGDWSDVDNTHRGAAARIRYILAGNELPDDYWGEVDEDPDGFRDAYAPYLVRGDDHIQAKEVADA